MGNSRSPNIKRFRVTQDRRDAVFDRRLVDIIDVLEDFLLEHDLTEIVVRVKLK